MMIHTFYKIIPLAIEFRKRDICLFKKRLGINAVANQLVASAILLNKSYFGMLKKNLTVTDAAVIAFVVGIRSR